ncbi:MAG: folate-binding protein [Rhizobiales bacterium]|nr:folate-binding protein [Hyphomicrobiales bacterium]
MTKLQASTLERRGVVKISGPEARQFLQGLITNDAELAKPGKAVYSALLTPQGKYLFDFFLTENAAGDLLLECDRGRADDLAKRLGTYKLRAKIDIANVSDDYAVIVSWGDGAAAIPDAISYADPRVDTLGFRHIVPANQADKILTASGAEAVPPKAYDGMRILQGVGEAPFDFEPERSFPLEINFDDLNAIDFKKGCFVGQEVTSRTKRRGSVRKRLLPCLIEGPLPKPHTPITAIGREVGMITSVDAESGHVLALMRLDFMHDVVLEVGEAEATPLKPAWATFAVDGVEEEDVEEE